MTDRAISLTGPLIIQQQEEPSPTQQAVDAKAAYDKAMAQIALQPDPVKALEGVREMLDALREIALPAMDWSARPAIHADGRDCYEQMPDHKLRRMLNHEFERSARWLDVTAKGDAVHVFLDRERLFVEEPAKRELREPPGPGKMVSDPSLGPACEAVLNMFNDDGVRVRRAAKHARDGQLMQCVRCSQRRRRSVYRCVACGETGMIPVMVEE